MKKHKIGIVGGGLTGLISALSLSNLNIDIDLIYRNEKGMDKDNRATAISEGNLKFLKDNISSLSTSLFNSVKKINLFYEKGTEINNFLNFQENKSLIYFFENDKFKTYLTKKLIKSKVEVINKKLKKIDISDNKIFLDNKSHRYDLIILCLGTQSPIYEKVIGNREINKNYNEFSITGNVEHQINDLGAKQFFLKEGPLAILPFKRKTFSIVWSIEKKYFSTLEQNLTENVQNKLEQLLKTKKIKIKKIKKYPLKLSLKKNYFKKNTIVLGDGLHSVHPVAGQGFNLVLRDIKSIKELIEYNLSLGLPIKNSTIPKDFSNKRKPENILFSLGIDTTRNFFKSNKYTDPFKKSILDSFSKSKFLKNLAKKIANTGIT